ncbi:MAG: hypothetical protein HY672_00300 [Chloroflexi bacterium]|nr:hypothetical protein [Chloroflexota bacterium]
MYRERFMHMVWRIQRLLSHQVLRRQEGFVLPWAIIIILLGVFIVVPVITMAGNAFRGHSRLEDQVRSFYAADAVVHAVMSDLVRGADAAPLPPNTYTAPIIDFGDIIPLIAVQVLESRTLATVKPVDYLVAGNPVVLVGFSPVGSGLDLAEDDDSYYKLTDAGTPPSLRYEVTSQAIEFPTVSFGEVRIVAQSTKSYTKVEVFVYNPNDPLHTQSGYNPIPDVTEILDLATTEETISVFLEDADVAYLNTLPTKTLKIKITATRTGGFRLDTDRVTFSIAGTVTTDERSVLGQPTISTGTLMSGSGSDLASDDVSYDKLSSSGAVIQFEALSDSFVFSGLDSVAIPFIARSSKDGVVVELFVYNPTDPAHTSGGYNPEPDLSATISLKNTDKAMTLSVSETDVAYLNTLSPISMRLKIRVTYTSDFQLEADMLAFIATSNSAPTTVTRQISQQYIDPGLRDPTMAQIASHEGYVLRIYNVHPGLLNVNWAAHAPDYKQAGKSVQVFRGVVISSGVVVPPGRTTSAVPSQGNDLLASSSSRPGEAFVRTGYIDVDMGLYTIVFYNDSSSTLITDPFAATGNPQDTWIYVPAYKDYLVDVQVGNVGLKAVVRQSPGPTEPPASPWSRTNISWTENLVFIQSWEPYGVEH